MHTSSRHTVLVAAILLAIAAIGWARNRFVVDRCAWRSGHTTAGIGGTDYHAITYSVTSHADGVSLARSEYVSYDNDTGQLAHWKDQRGWHHLAFARSEVGPDRLPTMFFTSILDWRVAGIGTFATSHQGEVARVVSVPYWFLAGLVSLPLWTAAARARRRGHRARRGLCLWCGYDRRGLKENACPECGHAQRGSLAGDAPGYGS